MKKKFCLLLLSIFIIPLFALFGCDEVSSYEAVVYSSWINSGFVAGSGTYREGDQVTLKATAFAGNHFVCWLYQGSTIIDEESAGYNLSNTQNTEEEITASTLTFNMQKEKQGKYTAVFSDENMMFVKFDSFKFSSSASSNPPKFNLSLWQGTEALSFYDQKDITFENSDPMPAEKVKEVLQLSATATKTVTANAQIFIGEENLRSFDLRAGINYKKSIETVKLDSYSYSTTFENHAYSIEFKFTYAETEYTLTLIYKELN